jgi:hypothetical protein
LLLTLCILRTAPKVSICFNSFFFILIYSQPPSTSHPRFPAQSTPSLPCGLPPMLRTRCRNVLSPTCHWGNARSCHLGVQASTACGAQTRRVSAVHGVSGLGRGGRTLLLSRPIQRRFPSHAGPLCTPAPPTSLTYRPLPRTRHRRIIPPPRTCVAARPSRLRLPIHGFPPYTRDSPALPRGRVTTRHSYSFATGSLPYAPRICMRCCSPLLEAREACDGATARNGGALSAGLLSRCVELESLSIQEG